MKAVKLVTILSHLIEYLNMTHVGERMKLLNCVSQDMEALAKILASAPRAVSKYRANVPDHLSGHCKMATGSGLGTRLLVWRPDPKRPCAKSGSGATRIRKLCRDLRFRRLQSDCRTREMRRKTDNIWREYGNFGALTSKITGRTSLASNGILQAL